MTREETALDQAVKRLDRAVQQLEHKMAAMGGGGDGALFAQDRARLASELDQARAREKELEAAGAEASAALGRAIAEIQAALSSANDATDATDEGDETPQDQTREA